MSHSPARILDVGQCDFDHGNISKVLAKSIGASIDRSHSADEALSAVKSQSYDLVLVNRIFDADADSGLALIQKLKSDDDTRTVPVMLVSNFEDAQNEAVKLGAIRGFGKDALNSAETEELLAGLLLR